MPDFTTVCRASDIPPTKGETFTIDGRLVAVFNDNGEFCAIDDLCPHMGASLGAGEVYDSVVACPWHAWRFNVKTGAWCDNPRLKVDAFEVRVVDGDVQVRVTPKKPSTP